MSLKKIQHRVALINDIAASARRQRPSSVCPLTGYIGSVCVLLAALFPAITAQAAVLTSSPISVSDPSTGAPNCYNVVLRTECDPAVTTVNYANARSYCQALGTGWDIATSHSSATDTALSAILTTSPPRAYVGGTENAATRVWTWQAGRMAGKVLYRGIYNAANTTICDTPPCQCEAGMFCGWSTGQPNLQTGSQNNLMLQASTPTWSAFASSGGAGTACYACERSFCSLAADCNATNTVAVNTSHPWVAGKQCGCECKDGFSGVRCDDIAPIFNINSQYLSQYMAECASVPISFPAAAAKCAAKNSGWALGTIPNAAVDAAAAALAPTFNLWLGAHDLDVPYTYKWEYGRLKGQAIYRGHFDTVSPYPCVVPPCAPAAGVYTNFKDYQPDRFGGDEHYLTIMRLTGKWNDRPISFDTGTTMSCYLCERSPCIGPVQQAAFTASWQFTAPDWLAYYDRRCTATPTTSATMTATATGTPSATDTAGTATLSTSATGTATATATVTTSTTGTATAATTATSTGTATVTPSTTGTATSKATSSVTPPVTGTATATVTIAGSKTRGTGSATRTTSASQSAHLHVTPTATPATAATTTGTYSGHTITQTPTHPTSATHAASELTTKHTATASRVPPLRTTNTTAAAPPTLAPEMLSSKCPEATLLLSVNDSARIAADDSDVTDAQIRSGALEITVVLTTANVSFVAPLVSIAVMAAARATDPRSLPSVADLGELACAMAAPVLLNLSGVAAVREVSCRLPPAPAYVLSGAERLEVRVSSSATTRPCGVPWWAAGSVLVRPSAGLSPAVVATQVASTVGALAASVASIVADGTAIELQLLALLLLLPCAAPTDHSSAAVVRFFVSPFFWAAADDEALFLSSAALSRSSSVTRQQRDGLARVVVGNVLLAVVCAALHAAVVGGLVAWRVRRQRADEDTAVPLQWRALLDDAAATARFPSLFLAAAQLLYAGVVYGAVNLWAAGSAADGGAVAVGVVFAVAVPGLHVWTVRRWTRGLYYDPYVLGNSAAADGSETQHATMRPGKAVRVWRSRADIPDAARVAGALQITLPPWAPQLVTTAEAPDRCLPRIAAAAMAGCLPIGRWGPPGPAQRAGSLVGAFRCGDEWWALVPYGLSAAFAVAAALPVYAAGAGECQNALTAIAMIAAVAAVLTALVRPHRALAATILTALAFALLGLAAGAHVAALRQPSNADAWALGTAAAVLVCVAVTLRSAHHIAVLAFERWFAPAQRGAADNDKALKKPVSHRTDVLTPATRSTLHRGRTAIVLGASLSSGVGTASTAPGCGPKSLTTSDVDAALDDNENSFSNSAMYCDDLASRSSDPDGEWEDTSTLPLEQGTDEVIWGLRGRVPAVDAISASCAPGTRPCSGTTAVESGPPAVTARAQLHNAGYTTSGLGTIINDLGADDESDAEFSETALGGSIRASMHDRRSSACPSSPVAAWSAVEERAQRWTQQQAAFWQQSLPLPGGTPQARTGKKADFKNSCVIAGHEVAAVLSSPSGIVVNDPASDISRLENTAAPAEADQRGGPSSPIPSHSQNPPAAVAAAAATAAHRFSGVAFQDPFGPFACSPASTPPCTAAASPTALRTHASYRAVARRASSVVQFRRSLSTHPSAGSDQDHASAGSSPAPARPRSPRSVSGDGRCTFYLDTCGSSHHSSRRHSSSSSPHSQQQTTASETARASHQWLRPAPIEEDYLSLGSMPLSFAFSAQDPPTPAAGPCFVDSLSALPFVL